MDAAQQLAIALQRFLTEQKPQPSLKPLSASQSIEAQAAGQRRAEIENRTYHMGNKPTLGLDYDDRLRVRLGCCATTAYGYLELYNHDPAGLRHTRLGKKYHITERAVREWEGDPIPSVS